MKAWQGIAERLNKLPSFNMESVNSKSCQNQFNTLMARHCMQEAESAKASGIDKDCLRKKTIKGSDTKDCAGAVVCELAMQHLIEQRLADAKRPADTEENSELLPTDTATPPISKKTPTKLKHAIMAFLVPLMESQVEQTQGIQAVLC
ncbi:unnamed protein product [Phytophthora fragariaefolia]|uniref:Unnamed protein product n=1 Tax=Phytophthora fragariaefolia TaxID=1490495 RepID=A0A9W6U4S8_9STRA|nr:unnamed protein product [Phytophthora fragariaefolia]